MLSRLCGFPSVRTRHEVGDSRRALFSSNGTGSLLCLAAAAWARSTALKTLSSEML